MSDELQFIVPRGLEILGAIVVDDGGPEGVQKAGEYAVKMRSMLGQSAASAKSVDVISGISVDASGNVEYHLYQPGEPPNIELLEINQNSNDFDATVWRNLSLLYCQMEFNVPLYLSATPNASGLFDLFLQQIFVEF